jgi:hypothetical protein
VVGHGVIAPMVADNASDLPLWLLWTTSEYVLATRDLAFLDEQIPAWPLYGSEAHTDSVRNLLARCYRHQVEQVGVGEHGVARMLNDDWNDGLLGTFAQRPSRKPRKKARACSTPPCPRGCLITYARMLTYAGKAPTQSRRFAKAPQATAKPPASNGPANGCAAHGLGPRLAGWARARCGSSRNPGPLSAESPRPNKAVR